MISRENFLDTVQTNTIIGYSEGYSDGYERAVADLIEAINGYAEEEEGFDYGTLLKALFDTGSNRAVFRIKYETAVAKAKEEGFRHYPSEDIYLRL